MTFSSDSVDQRPKHGIKHLLRRFLHDELKLELSEDKTLITHARTGKARFLGYDIVAQHSDDKLTGGKRSINSKIGLRVPEEAITRRCAPYLCHGKPWHRSQMLSDRDHSIISQYQAEYRGVVQYYLLAVNVCHLNRLHWVMETSLLKTLAGKHGSSVAKMARSIRPPSTRRMGHGCASRPRSNGAGQETTGRAIRWYTTETAEESGAHRPLARPVHHQRQRVDSSAPRRPL